MFGYNFVYMLLLDIICISIICMRSHPAGSKRFKMGKKQRGSRGHGEETAQKKRVRLSTYIMQSSALTMDDVLTSLGIALVSVGQTAIEIVSLMYFIQNNSAEVARILDEKHSPVGTPLDNIPLPIYRSFRAGYTRVTDDVPESTASGAAESAAESFAEIADDAPAAVAAEGSAPKHSGLRL